MPHLNKQISDFLPNFPEDIIEQWIGYYAVYNGWPPKGNINDVPKGDWGSKLLSRPLSFWQKIKWHDQFINLNKITFNYAVDTTLDQIIMAQAVSETNDYSILMGKENKARFDRIVTYILKNGGLPRKPILICNNKIFEIADGMHRIAAYIFLSSLQYKLVRKHYFRNCEIEIITANEEILVWIGYI